MTETQRTLAALVDAQHAAAAKLAAVLESLYGRRSRFVPRDRWIAYVHNASEHCRRIVAARARVPMPSRATWARALELLIRNGAA